MKKILFLIIIGVVLYDYAARNPDLFRQSYEQSSAPDELLQNAYKNRHSNLQLQGSGTVSRLLHDDLDGSRHQKFILQLASGQKILIVHNIDLAARINSLSIGDKIEFSGEYEWNSRGGLIHWTHHDPAGRHTGGWLKHSGKIYQ